MEGGENVGGSSRFIISVRRSLHLCECLWPPLLEREIFPHFIRIHSICGSKCRIPCSLDELSKLLVYFIFAE